MNAVFDHFSFFVLRLPARPISELIESIETNLTKPSDLLDSLLQQPRLAEAIYLSSPDLYSTWQMAQGKKMDPSLQKSLWRYLIRSYGRATPYGLFAGVGVGTIGKTSRIELGPNPWYNVSRTDSLVPITIAKTFINDPQIRPLLRYTLNNSLYKVGDQFRFSERTDSLKASIVLSSFPATADLARLVGYLSKHGNASFTDLIRLYGEDYQQEVSVYINQLIDDQFLISQLALPVTGLEMGDYLIDQVKQLPLHPTLHDQLIKAKNLLAESPVKLSTLKQVQSMFEDIVPEEPEGRTQSLVQTDLFFAAEHLELPSVTVNQITRQFNQLRSCLHHPYVSPLSDFAKRFKDRFDGQVIDLLTALDPEVGVGFMQDNLTGQPFISDLFEAPSQSSSKSDHYRQFQEQLLSRYLLNACFEVEVTDADLQTLDGNEQVGLPPSWYIHGELFSKANDQSLGETNDTWRFVLNSTVSGSSAYFLGRFCQGHPALHQLVQQLCSWEQTQYPNDILAEVVHLPTAPLRAGNVVTRPTLRPIEIPYLTPASVAENQTVSLADIAISVNDAESVRLIHKKTGKRIRPRHSSAHNPLFGDEVYQFLMAVQASETPTMAWSWGPFNHLPFLPRLLYKNLIISPAQWMIQKEQLPASTIHSANLIRQHYQLPRYVFLIEGDNKLLLDLEFEPTQQIFVDEIRRQDRVFLKEWIGQNYRTWVQDGAHEYCSELVIPVKTLSANKVTPKIEQTVKFNNLVQRNFMPGGEWFYTKVYLNDTFSDQFLITVLIPFLRYVKKKGWINQVFFIRYSDPEYHLRIRFKITPSHNVHLGKAWQKALLALQESGFISRMQLDTYQRELERYNPDLIEDCEAIFSADSSCFLSWLEKIGEVTEEDRIRLALYSVDSLLTDFSLSMEQKVNISHQLQQAFLKEHVVYKELKKKLNQKYRDHCHSFFNQSQLETSLLEERSLKIEIPVKRILNYFIQAKDSKPFYSLLSSLIHMMLNRIFPTHQRKHELVIYHFLARHYESKLARQ